MGNKYLERGVDPDKIDVHGAILNNYKGLYPNAFCKILPFDLMPEHVMILHSDGAGTKTSLAYIYWKETGDMSVWRGVVQDSIVMNLDDIACVGGLTGSIYLTSAINRNKSIIPGDVVAELINGADVFLDKMREFGIDIANGGGETADVGDLVRTVTVDNSMSCIMPRCNVIDNGNIKPGDFIVGLSSSGQAIYESGYNGGMGSNGLTSARHDIFSPVYRVLRPESYDTAMDAGKDQNNKLSYCGSKRLSDPVPPICYTDASQGDIPYKNKVFNGQEHDAIKAQRPADWYTGKRFEDVDYGKLVLSPTRTYAPIIKKLHNEKITNDVSGMVHCSGGGQTKVLHSLSGPMRVVKDNMFSAPPLFEIIQKESKETWHNMYKNFNMGHRMEIYTPSEDVANEILHIASTFGVAARIVGRVEKSKIKELIIKSQYGEFTYPSR